MPGEDWNLDAVIALALLLPDSYRLHTRKLLTVGCQVCYIQTVRANRIASFTLMPYRRLAGIWCRFSLQAFVDGVANPEAAHEIERLLL